MVDDHVHQGHFTEYMDDNFDLFQVVRGVASRGSHDTKTLCPTCLPSSGGSGEIYFWPPRSDLEFSYPTWRSS